MVRPYCSSENCVLSQGAGANLLHVWIGFLVTQCVWELEGVKSFKGHFLLRAYFCLSGKDSGQNHLLQGLSLSPSTEMQQILFNFI